MCMIIVGERITNIQAVDNASVYNCDGYGIATKNWLKTTGDYPTFRKWLLEIDEPFIAHMRKASAGDISPMNFQPLDCGWGYVAHNGTIFQLVGDIEGRSDSNLLGSILENVTFDKGTITLLDVLLDGDRLALIDKKSGEILTWGEWYEDDGVKYSSSYYQDNIVAVYGTLKYGYGNHGVIEGGEFLGEFYTNEKYPMVKGPGFPYLYNEPGVGHNIVVELYRVDTDTLKNLDNLEGVDFGHYYRERIRVGNFNPWVYFAAHERDKDKELLEEYFDDDFCDCDRY